MQTGSYRMKDPTLAIGDNSEGAAMLTIPAGSVVVVEDPKTDPLEMFTVLWNGRRVRMYARDLNLRGEVLPPRAA